MNILNIKFLSQNAKEAYQEGSLLNYQTKGSSGFDIRAVSILLPNGENIDLKLQESFILKTGSRICVQVGIAMSIVDGFEVQIRPRSGLAFKHGITIVNTPGTVDSDYRGEIGAILLNTSDKDFEIKFGDRIAQAVVSQIFQCKINITENLDETVRGDGRFGSTGVK